MRFGHQEDYYAVTLSRDSIKFSPGGKKIVNFFAQDTCYDDIMASLHEMAARDNMLGSEIN